MTPRRVQSRARARGAAPAGCRIGRQYRLGALVPLVLALAVQPAHARRGDTCPRECKAQVGACTTCVKTEVGAARRACAGDRAARRHCRSEAAAEGRALVARCKALASPCRACCTASGTACPAAGRPPVCPIGRTVTFTPPPRRDRATLPLPGVGNGNLLVLETPGGRLELDPARRGPLTVLGQCTTWIAACVAPPDRTLDDCARSAPRCTTTAPWDEAGPCCPAACFDAYRRARIDAPADEPPLDTFTQVYFDDAGCFPGVRAAVGR